MQIFEDEAGLLAEQRSLSTECSYRCFIYERLGKIVDYDVAVAGMQNIYIEGRLDSTPHTINVIKGDFLLIESSNRSFEDEFYVNANSGYQAGGGNTCIQISLDNKYKNGFLDEGETHNAIDDDDLNGIVYKRYEVTDNIIKNSLRSINYGMDTSTYCRSKATVTQFELSNKDYFYCDRENEKGIFFSKIFNCSVTSITEGVPDTKVYYSGSSWKDNLQGSTLVPISGDTIDAEYMILSSNAELNRLEVYGTLESDGLEVGDYFTIETYRRKLVKIVAGYRSIGSDWYLLFGGIIRTDGFVVSDDNRTINIKCFGHAKDLENNYAYEAADGSYFHILSGVTIVGFSVYGNVSYGVKTINYLFSNGVAIPGINPIYVDKWFGGSRNRLIRFRPSDELSYDNGPWVTVSNSIYGNDGANVKYEEEGTYNSLERAGLISFDTDEDATIKEYGAVALSFDGGNEVDIGFSNFIVLFYDAGTATYTDITGTIIDSDGYHIDTISQTGDEIIICFKSQFFGLAMTLLSKSDYVGGVEFKYSKGEDWLALAVTDGTAGCTQSGNITYDDPGDWKPFFQDFGGTIGEVSNVYGIKIRSTSPGGTVILGMLQPFIKLYGKSGVNLDVIINYRNLPKKSVEDNVIVRHDSNNNPTVTNWYSHITGALLIEQLCTAAGIDSTKRNIPDLEVDLGKSVISLIGRCPNQNYGKLPCCSCYDSASDTYFFGVGNEVWKMTNEGFVLIGKLDPYVGDSSWDTEVTGLVDWDKVTWCLDIWKMKIDGNGYLQGIAIWHPQRRSATYYNEFHDDLHEFGRSTPCIIFRSTNLTSITHQTQADNPAGNGWSQIKSGELCHRRGVQADPGNPWAIGRLDLVLGMGRGENICIPIPQFINKLEWPGGFDTDDNYLGNAKDIEQERITTQCEADSILRYHSGTKWLVYYKYAGGIYPDDPPPDDDVGFPFTLGQAGLMIWDEVNDRWITVINTEEILYGIGAVSVTAGGAFSSVLFGNYGAAPPDGGNGYDYDFLCGDGVDGSGNFWFSEMYWYDGWGTLPAAVTLVRSKNRIIRMSSVGVRTVVFDFSVDNPEAGSSLSGDDIYYGTVITMVWDDVQNVLHGTLLARNTMEYHYYAYDITNDKLYTTQTANNFTFDVNRQFIKGCYCSDGYLYWYYTDQRFRESSAVLVRVSWDVINGFEITSLSSIRTSEWNGGADLIEGSGMSIFGVTAPNDNYIFKYDSSYKVWIFHGKFDTDTIRKSIERIGEILGYRLLIKPTKFLHLLDRFTGLDTVTLNREVISKVGDVSEYPHIYNNVSVNWYDPEGSRGTESFGSTGINKEPLTINNSLIIDEHIALELAKIIWYKLVGWKNYIDNTELIFYHQIEVQDIVYIDVPLKFSKINSSQQYLIEELVFNLINWIVKLSVVEIEEISEGS